MAQSRWKVYSDEGEYLATCKYILDAAAILGAHGIPGYTIRDHDHYVVWTDGDDGVAGDSFDNVAEVVRLRTVVRPDKRSGQEAGR